MQGFDAWITSDQYAHLEDLLYITIYSNRLNRHVSSCWCMRVGRPLIKLINFLI